ncbi:hypothetical protein QYE76_014881 [Lolium multiflorum]|uniref:CCHC-type domain-containing protein n=1 Tax=Lolium multiflorum TaxID=4521 RepID=A0AAD8U5J2_LOLMU|nr:hypothetical protein QYE76_014881 [Lolium multiflorum]
MKDPGEADVILNIKLIKNESGITLTQSHYVEKILSRFGYIDSKPSSTPYDPGVTLRKNRRSAIDQLRYSQIVGSLMYLASATRPDISFAVSKLRHPVVLEGYSDSNWISDVADLYATSGFWEALTRSLKFFITGRLPSKSGGAASAVCNAVHFDPSFLSSTTLSSTTLRCDNRYTSTATSTDRDNKIVNQENKNSADIITWREYEALRNEMRREFRTKDDELKGTVDEIKQTLEATNVTVTGLADQVTDIQRNIADMRLAIENLTAQQQQDDDEDPELEDDAHNARGAPRGHRPRGFHLAVMVVDKMKKMDWIEKLWSLHPHYSEDRKIKLASSEFDGYALRWWDSLVRNLDEDGAQPIRTWHAMKEAMTSRFVPTNYMRNIFDKLTLLRQGVKTVDEYYMEMEMLMQRGRVRESLEMTMQRFLNGLKYDVKGIVRHYTYTNMNQLLHHAREAESQLAEEAKVKGRATGAGRFTPRAPSTASAPSTRSVPYSTPPSKPVSNVSNAKKSESAASTSGSSMSTTRNRDMLCHTCGGKGHFKRDCPNRKVMFINEDNEHETGDDVDPNAPDDDDYDTDGEDAYPSMLAPLLCRSVLLMCCLVHLLSCNLFQTKALVGPDKACKVIIDGGSCRNLASKELCTKLKLKYLPHPHPYYIQWLSDNGEMKEFDVFPEEVPQDYHHCEESHAGGLMGHFGREKTLLMLADHFYWPKMRRDVDRYVRRCITCNKSKSKLKPHDTLEKAGDEAAVQTTCHPQTDGQKVVNRILSQLLRSMIKKNLKEWEECLPHVEFAYNRAVHYTTELCPFEVVYGFKPITPLDLLPLPIHERVNMEASKRADFVRKIHVKTKELIEKKGKSNAARMNKKRKEMLFKPGDLVWVHFRKDRFPKPRKSKLKPRGAGPYKVLAKINDNAYSIDLLEDEFGVSNSFNVADLTPYDREDLGASGSTPFEGGGGDDEDIPTSLLPPLPTEDEPAVKLKSNEVRIGSMTRARMKRRQASHEERGGREAGHGAGHEDISWTREGGAGGMRERIRRSPGSADRPTPAACPELVPDAYISALDDP